MTELLIVMVVALVVIAGATLVGPPQLLLDLASA